MNSYVTSKIGRKTGIEVAQALKYSECYSLQDERVAINKDGEKVSPVLRSSQYDASSTTSDTSAQFHRRKNASSVPFNHRMEDESEREDDEEDEEDNEGSVQLAYHQADIDDDAYRAGGPLAKRETQDQQPLSEYDRTILARLGQNTEQLFHARGQVPLLSNFTKNNSYPPTTSGRMSEASDEQTNYPQFRISKQAENLGVQVARPEQDPPTGTEIGHNHHDRYRGKHIKELNQGYRVGESQRQKIAERTGVNKRKIRHVPNSSIALDVQKAVDRHDLPPSIQGHGKYPISLHQGQGLTTGATQDWQGSDISILVPIALQTHAGNISGQPLQKQYNTHAGHDHVPLDAQQVKALFDAQTNNNDEEPKISKLHDKLAVVAKGSSEQQAQFLGKLAIEDWEIAGTWFTEQFSALTKQMQHSRQERRRIALTFEEEIRQRHKDVGEEETRLDIALKQMKQSGDAVLQKSTPKRSQGYPTKG